MHASAPPKTSTYLHYHIEQRWSESKGGEVRSEGFNLTGQTELLTEVSLNDGGKKMFLSRGACARDNRNIKTAI
jgi:hypothetical protein